MKSIGSKKTLQRERRHKRIRAKIIGTGMVPRLAVYKSNRFIHAQLIDDSTNRSLAGIVSRMAGKTKTEAAGEAGKAIAKIAQEKKIFKVVFDRGGFLYAGRVRAFAEGAREGGLIF